MALDGIFLNSILLQLRSTILNGKIEKITQPESDEIILYIKATGKSQRLLISANANYPKVHLTSLQKQNPLQAPMFCMILRKYLNNAHLLSIDQIDFDRILVFRFTAMDELGFDSVYKLIVEIMGRHSNITLVRERDNVVMDSIKHLTPDINRYRTLLPGVKYTFPPASLKLNPSEFAFNDFINAISKLEKPYKENVYGKLFNGMSSTLSKELFLLTEKMLLSEDFEGIFSTLTNYFLNLSHYNNCLIYYDNNLPLDFYCYDLKLYEHLNKKLYSSPSQLVEDFYLEKDSEERLNNRTADLQKLVNTNIQRCERKLNLLMDSLEKCKDKDLYRLYGELLTSNIYDIEPGIKEYEALNYYDENTSFISIPLDVNKSPSQNIQSFYHKYNKLKKTEEMNKLQIEEAKNELEYLNSVLHNIKSSTCHEDIIEIKSELMEGGYLKFKKSKQNKNKKSSPLHFMSTQGIDIYVGKNNVQNEFLTLKFAHNKDLWLHVKDMPGSHVIVKASSVDDSTLREAAELAAYYSKGKESSKVAVDYTEIKNVKKIPGGKPGMVNYQNFKTLYVTPQIPKGVTKK